MRQLIRSSGFSLMTAGLAIGIALSFAVGWLAEGRDNSPVSIETQPLARSGIEYLRKCDKSTMAGYALVPDGISSEWTRVQGFGTKPAPGCERGRALARRTGVGSYEVQLISGGTPTSGPDSCLGPEFEDGIHFPILVTPETAGLEIHASHRTVCTADRGLAEQVIITDGNGEPVDAYFTIAQLARYKP